MEERTSRHPRYRSNGRSGTRPRSRAFRRRRALLLAACAALLGVALAATVHSTAQARSTSAVPTGTVARGAEPAAAAPPPAATLGGTALGAAVPAAGAITPELDAEINGIIDANPDYEIGVALLDLSGGADHEVHQYGIEEPFVAASTAKVLAAEAFYHLVETGEASLEDRLGDYTAEFQLRAMIQQSDNDSWALIMDAVGHAELTDYAASMGVDYSPESNTLTPADMARILAGLYSGTLLEPADTAQLLAFMQDTNFETLIPAAVPAGVAVFHKYGLLGGQLHDAAILAADGHAYALVIYTKGDDLASVPERTDLIHQVTQAVADTLF